MRKLFSYFTVLLLFSFIVSGCSKEENDIITSGNNRFTGSYGFRFTYGFSGSGIMYVDHDGNFDFPVNITSSGNTFNASIKGSVKNSGILDAIVFKDTIAQGNISGQLYVSGESGGSYVGNGYVAYWIANYIY